MIADSLIIIPTYNERDNIGPLLEQIIQLDKKFDLLIIDDNSPDGTADIVKDHQTRHPNRIHLIERPAKLGLGTAYIQGFTWALNKSYSNIFEMDADFSHNPSDLIPLYENCREHNGMSIGSRYIKGVAIVHWPIGRLLLSYYASLYVRMITRMTIRDATAGFVCYSRDLLNRLDLKKIRMKGYGFQIEMKFKAWKLGFPLHEIPVIFINRKAGTSKMSGGIFSEAFLGVVHMKLSSLRRNYSKHISRLP